jgi:tRNA G18 (ribose-2'-O)-methylase SpoU
MAKLKLDELNRVSVADFKNQQKLPIVLVLDEVRSLHNVGSIFRTADGFAVEAMVLCGITAQPPHREIEKTALGATQSVDWSYFPSTMAAVLELKAKGYTVLALEQASESTLLTDFTPTAKTKYAIILGNEVNGVNDEVMKLVDGCLEIPQFGTKHSFNVVVSAGIVLWDFFAKWHKK